MQSERVRLKLNELKSQGCTGIYRGVGDCSGEVKLWQDQMCSVNDPINANRCSPSLKWCEGFERNGVVDP